MTPDVLLIRKMMSRQNLTRAESAELLEAILRTDDEGWKILAYCVASQTKGETVDEILGMFDAMRRLTGEYDLDLSGRQPLDISSAGGSGVHPLLPGGRGLGGADHQALLLEADQRHG
jgi:anthranilate phosphoribosyltransferase